MGRSHSGFTLIELMIVVTIIVIIASIAVPVLIAARLTANETATIETLRSVCTAQHQFRQSGKADEDSDGVGEYGSLGELSGLVGVRGGLSKVPTDLTASMRNMTEWGEVNKSGYVYRVYLPGLDGKGVREQPNGGTLPGSVGADLSELRWSCYAWPMRYNVTGRRTFFVGALGEIYFVENSDYSGPNDLEIRPGSALITADLDSMTAQTAVGTRGGDGKIWRPVQ